MAIPTVILGLGACAGPVIAGLAWGASACSSFLLSPMLEKLMPSEQKLVAEACKKKGIDIDAEKQGLDQLT